MEQEQLRHWIEVAAGRAEADAVLKNAGYVNVFSGEVLHGDIAVADGRVVGIGTYRGRVEYNLTGRVVCPGFVDAHIHLESSLAAPAAFVRATLRHGTAAVVADPHEIANVLGTGGIEYMLQATEGLPMDVYFMLPSCVPATPLDEAGAVLDAADIAPFYEHPRVLGLAEMMNAFGVVQADEAVLAKLAGARGRIDGHAPGLSGPALCACTAAGIASDHECSTLDEALEKLRRGQYILIREGTAARNLAALAPLLTPQYAHRCAFCTDDKHPSDLLELGHMDYICRRAVQDFGVDPVLAVRCASLSAAQYFGLRHTGAVAPGYWADLAVVDNLQDFRVEQVFRRGRLLFDHGQLADFPAPKPDAALEARARDTFRLPPLTAADFQTRKPLGVLGLVPGEIITTDNGMAAAADPDRDILKIAVIERHRGTGHIGLGYVQGYGLRRGAVATSVAHDSHNLIVVGAGDEEMAFAANQVIARRGGIVVADGGAVTGAVTLELAGLMSAQPLEALNAALEAAKAAAYAQGVCRGIDPFMTLSFLSLPVIPQLRVTTRGVLDAARQAYL